MGPLFSLGLLTALAGLGMGALFLIARLFLPARAALALALLMTASGVTGCLLGMLVQLPFAEDQLVSGVAVARFLLVILASGSASVVGALWTFLHWRADRLRRGEAQAFD